MKPPDLIHGADNVMEEAGLNFIALILCFASHSDY